MECKYLIPRFLDKLENFPEVTKEKILNYAWGALERYIFCFRMLMIIRIY